MSGGIVIDQRDAARDEGLARRGAAVLALVAGVLHLGQVRTHFDDDWTFAAFFIVVGLLQVLGGVYLARPVGPRRLVPAVAAFGVVGSLATIGVWAVSRALGLPFGAEPGSRETVGLADAAAGLFELFTALLLLHWLAARRRSRPRAIGAAAMVGAMALVALWRLTRAAGLFDPDPRLVIAPGLTDATAVVFLLVTVALFASLALARGIRQGACAGRCPARRVHARVSGARRDRHLHVRDRAALRSRGSALVGHGHRPPCNAPSWPGQAERLRDGAQLLHEP